MTLRKGRDLTEYDRPDSTPVILVNETLAHRLWPGQNPIGQIIQGDCAKERQVVGVVGDVRHLALEKGSVQRCTYRCASARTMDRGIWWCVRAFRLARLVRAWNKPPAYCAGPPERGHTAVDATCGQGRVTTTLHRSAAYGLCRFRASAGVTRHLRSDFVFGQPKAARDRHSYGFGGVEE